MTIKYHSKVSNSIVCLNLHSFRVATWQFKKMLIQNYLIYVSFHTLVSNFYVTTRQKSLRTAIKNSKWPCWWGKTPAAGTICTWKTLKLNINSIHHLHRQFNLLNNLSSNFHHSAPIWLMKPVPADWEKFFESRTHRLCLNL